MTGLEVKSIQTLAQEALGDCKYIKTKETDWSDPEHPDKITVEYLNAPCAFDIEDTSFTDDEGKKTCIMYEWTLGLNGLCIIGRTWDEFFDVMLEIQKGLGLTEKKRMIIYVHNLEHEFSFLRAQYEWDCIFALKKRKIVKARTVCFEFRCSYILSGYSLKKVGENLVKYKVEKLSGDLDYSLKRHSETTMSDKELDYCLHDVYVVMAYIQECIEYDGDITKIPLTSTGYVRKFCREKCLGSTQAKYKTKEQKEFSKTIKSLTITPEEYKQLKRGFQGGFTHANYLSVGKVISDVQSYDFTSSYPAVMVTEKFPMSKGKVVEVNSLDDFFKYLNMYCCIFDIKFTGLQANTMVEHPISKSKCWGLKNFTEDNGRIVDADELTTTITEQDFYTISDFYRWDSMNINNMIIYQKDYLPKLFIESILSLYKDKTELKGLKDYVVEYQKKKGMLNSAYGMSVTDINRNSIKYENNQWIEVEADTTKNIEKYNKDRKRFLFYPWGVWITAYARRNLFKGIKEFGSDYIYSDTDSIKSRHPYAHKAWIEAYNNGVKEKIIKISEHYSLDIQKFIPKTKDGKEKMIGAWDDEGCMREFKTLGAKRYMCTTKNKKGEWELEITIAGLGKGEGGKYIREQGKDILDCYDFFNDQMFIPAERTGKLLHSYIDEPREGILEDYNGVKYQYFEKTSVHLQPCEFRLSMFDGFLDFLETYIFDKELG